MSRNRIDVPSQAFMRTVQARKLRGDDRWELVENHSVLAPYRVKAPNGGLCEVCKKKGSGELVEVIHDVARTPFIRLNVPQGAHGRSEYRFMANKATRVLSGKRVCMACGGFGSRTTLPTQAFSPAKKPNDVTAVPVRKTTRKQRAAEKRASKEPAFATTL